MDQALAKLIVLSMKAQLRRSLRGARTVRGALLLLMAVGFVALMVGPSLATALFMRRQPALDHFSGAAEPYAALGLLGFCLTFILTSAGEKAIYFTPAEVDFLFPAPFHRRALLTYKMGRTALGLLLLSLFCSLTMLLFFRSWLAGFVGLLLSLGLIQLVAMATAMAAQRVAEAAYTRGRRAVAGLILVLAVV